MRQECASQSLLHVISEDCARIVVLAWCRDVRGRGKCGEPNPRSLDRRTADRPLVRPAWQSHAVQTGSCLHQTGSRALSCATVSARLDAAAQTAVAVRRIAGWAEAITTKRQWFPASSGSRTAAPDRLREEFRVVRSGRMPRLSLSYRPSIRGYLPDRDSLPPQRSRHSRPSPRPGTMPRSQ
jgi:hypothetical protein